MILRPYGKEDCGQTARLFYETVHTVNARDYSPSQLAAWAPAPPRPEAWHASFCGHYALVAEENGAVVGFGDIDGTGYLDRLYVHKDYQGRGVAAALCAALEQHAAGMPVTVHASVTARPFFEKRGYRVCRRQQVLRAGVALTNFVMINGAGPAPGGVLAAEGRKGRPQGLPFSRISEY